MTVRDGDDCTKKIILLIILSLYTVVLAFILSRQHIILVRSDHLSRWYATEKLFSQGRSIYDPQNGVEVVSLNNIRVDPVEGSFFYPAHLLLFTAPLAFFSYPVAHFIWLIAIQWLFILSIWVISTQTGWPHTTNQFTIYLLLALFFIPNVQNTIWGQFNPISVLSLALVFVLLQRERHFLAGVLAVGLTFKPQTMPLTLIFLIIWALFERERWSFFLGFGLSLFACWAFAELLEPNWVSGFIRSVVAYAEFHQPSSVLDLYFKTGGIIEGFVIIASVVLFLIFRRSKSNSLPFVGCMVLSLAAWWLCMPVLGMMILTALPMALVLLLWALERKFGSIYNKAVLWFALLYLIGFAGFLYGLSSPELYGVHIQLAELAYKTLMPFSMLVLALFVMLPFVQSRSERLNVPGLLILLVL